MKTNNKHNTKTETKVASGNVYDIITDRIIEQLSQGIVPWHKPWVGGSAMAISYETQRPYSMLNQLLLGKPGEWLTWNKIQELGGKIKKGAKSGIYVFTKSFNVKETKENEDGTQEEIIEERRCLKWYRAFHIDDIEGIASKIQPTVANPDNSPINEADNIVFNYLMRETSLTFQSDRESGRAYYSPSEDKVVVPMIEQFESSEEYYSTAFHELTHSTMKASRCDRENDNKLAAFGNTDYSREELVAEIGSAMLCNHAGLNEEKTFKNSVAYIGGWLKALQNDKKMISWAATRAEKAAKYILNGSNNEQNN